MGKSGVIDGSHGCGAYSMEAVSDAYPNTKLPVHLLQEMHQSCSKQRGSSISQLKTKFGDYFTFERLDPAKPFQLVPGYAYLVTDATHSVTFDYTRSKDSIRIIDNMRGEVTISAN